MKKIYVAIIAIFIQSTIIAQSNFDLAHTTWIKTKAERVDGSRIIDHLQIDRDKGITIFSEDSVRMIVDVSMETSGKYKVSKNYLILYTTLRYLIEKHTDKELVYSEVKEGMKEGFADDEINRYYFVSSKYYYDSLIANHLVNINGDTITSDNKMYPILNHNILSSYFFDGLGNPQFNGKIAGEFIISPMKTVFNIKISEHDGFNDKNVKRLISAIEKTSGKWILPATNKPYFIKVKYNLVFNTVKDGSFTWTGHYFHLEDNFQEKPKFPENQTRLANEYYGKGLKLVENNKFNEAIECFTKCIENDSIYLSAYYDRAYANYTINNVDKACMDWKYLTDLDQMKAKEYYETKCNK